MAEDLSDRLVRLPFYFDLSESEQARVIDAVRSFETSGSAGIRNLQRTLAEQGAGQVRIPETLPQ